MITIRPMTPQDFAECARIVRACGHGELDVSASVAGGTHEVFEMGGRVIAHCRWQPSVQDPKRVLVHAFSVDPAFHGTGTYIRAHRALERRGAAFGFTEAVCHVPDGHEAYRQYLDRAGYRVCARRPGVTFLTKELRNVRRT